MGLFFLCCCFDESHKEVIDSIKFDHDSEQPSTIAEHENFWIAIHKQKQHFRDNRRGSVIDTIGWPASNVPVGFRCEGILKDTTTVSSSSKTLITIQFTPNLPDLSSYSIMWDHGYSVWTSNLAVLSRKGKLPVCTERCCPWFPFT